MVEKSEKVMVSRSRHDALHDDPLRCDRSGATMPANMAATAISSCRSHLTLREVRTTKDEVSRPPNGIRYFVLRTSYFVLFMGPAMKSPWANTINPEAFFVNVTPADTVISPLIVIVPVP